MTPPLLRNFLMIKNLWFRVADHHRHQQHQQLQNHCHFLCTLLLKTTFSSRVVCCGSSVGGFSRAGLAGPVQLVFSPLHPNTQTILEGTAVCRQSWGCKEKCEISQTSRATLFQHLSNYLPGASYDFVQFMKEMSSTATMWSPTVVLSILIPLNQI